MLQPAYGYHTTPPQPNHNVTPTHIEPEQYNPWSNSTNKSQAPEDGCINIRNMLSIKWWNNKASGIKLVSLYSNIKMMHGPINIRLIHFIYRNAVMWAASFSPFNFKNIKRCGSKICSNFLTILMLLSIEGWIWETYFYSWGYHANLRQRSRKKRYYIPGFSSNWNTLPKNTFKKILLTPSQM